jgi:hypothetical protein
MMTVQVRAMAKTLAISISAVCVGIVCGSDARAATVAPVAVVSDAAASSLFTSTNWDGIPAVSDFHDIETHADASAKTTCRFARSKSALLARCTAYEIPRNTKAYSEASAIQQGDYIALIVSTNLDVRAPGMYILFVNPLNINQSMGTMPNSSTLSWKSSVDTTPISWSVNFDVPFSSFALPAPADQKWRVSVMRQDTSARSVFTWPGVPIADAARPSGQAEIPDLVIR